MNKEELDQVSRIQLRWIIDNIENKDYAIALSFTKHLLRTLKQLKNTQK